MASLNIFTCANRKYEDFTLIFAASCLWSNPHATVEVGLQSSKRFNQANRKALSLLASAFGDNAFLVRDAIWSDKDGQKILPNSVRFITEPLLPSDYVYISDIDVVTLDPNLEVRYLEHMARTGLSYSNWVRTGTTKLCGNRHFCRRDWQYPLPPYEDLFATKIGDEELLYELVKRKLGFDPPREEKAIQVPGIHISPRREPYGSMKNGRKRPGWMITPHRPAWRRFRETPLFNELEPLFSDRIRESITILDQSLSRAA